MGSFTLLTPDTLLIEKGDEAEGTLRKAFRLTREMDHHREFQLWPWAIWQTVLKEGADEAGWERLFSGIERGEACMARLQTLQQEGLKRARERADGLMARSTPSGNWPEDLREGQAGAVASYFSNPLKPSFLDLAPGQGKTRVALEVAKALGGGRVWASNPTLVRQWKDEGLRWWPEAFPKMRKGAPPPKVDLRFGVPEKMEDLEKTPFLVIDEAHRLDRPVLALLSQAKVPVLGMSATPHWPMEMDGDFFTALGPVLSSPVQVGQSRVAVTVRAVEVQFPLPHEVRHDYLLAGNGIARHRIASSNHQKVKWVLDRIESTPGARVLVMGQYLEPLKEIAATLGVPVLSGTASSAGRYKAYKKFNAEASASGAILVTSGISDEGVDLPEADLIFQISGSPNDPVQEVQRLGRLLRPKNRTVTFYTLVTSQTVEEESSRQRRGAVEALGIVYELEIPKPDTMRL